MDKAECDRRAHSQTRHLSVILYNKEWSMYTCKTNRVYADTLLPRPGRDGIELSTMEAGAATPQSPSTPSVMPGLVISAGDFAQHVHGRRGKAETSSAADGVMDGATESPTDRAVHRLQLLRTVSSLCTISVHSGWLTRTIFEAS